MLLQSRHAEHTIVRCLLRVPGVEASQIDTEVEKTFRRLQKLKELQRMRDSVARTKSFLMLSNDFAQDE